MTYLSTFSYDFIFFIAEIFLIFAGVVFLTLPIVKLFKQLLNPKHGKFDK